MSKNRWLEEDGSCLLSLLPMCFKAMLHRVLGRTGRMTHCFRIDSVVCRLSFEK